MTTFHQKVFHIVARIPRGETMIYQEVARRAGKSSVCRSVGNILHKNMDREILCHRVIRLDGSIGGYNRRAK